MKRQTCSTCYRTTSDYTTKRTTDAYGGQHVWHTCQDCADQNRNEKSA